MEIQPRHVRETRIAAAIALVALAAGAASDFLLDFWARNVMLTSVVANLLVLMVGVAVVNEYLAGRSARRWRLLGQFVLLELGRSARDVWIVLLERLGLEEGRDLPLDELRARDVPVRVYVPYGADWFRFWLRRAAESRGA